MSAAVGPLLVLGVGNILLRDDGVGIHLLHELERLTGRGDVVLPRDTRLIDGGTLGAALLPSLAGARAILVLDAVDLRLAPGAVAVLPGDAMRRPNGRTPAVQRAGVADLIAAARLADVLPSAVTLVGVQPGAITPGLALTDVVRDALPAAVAAALDALRRLDVVTAASVASLDFGFEMTGSAA